MYCFYRENRYVLFLTENYAALNILKNPNNYLSDELSVGQTHEDGEPLDLSGSEPFVLFGSSFPKDQEFTQVNLCDHQSAETMFDPPAYRGFRKVHISA